MLLEPPPKPCTNTRSAIAGAEGSDRVVRPNGPLGYCVSKLSTSFRLAKGRVNMDRLGDLAVISGHGTLRDRSVSLRRVKQLEVNGYAQKLTLSDIRRALSERAILI